MRESNAVNRKGLANICLCVFKLTVHIKSRANVQNQNYLPEGEVTRALNWIHSILY